jgi:protein-L-isoaspartate(D-aspartate) O-methyltransferase
MQMVETQLKARNITDAKVLKAMSEVPRHEFVPPELHDISYGDFPLPIGEDQTISQPYIVALMTQELGLTGDETVLEIGAGSGYQAAILSRIVKQVYTVERIHSLAVHAGNVLKKLCYMNVHVVEGDGTMGLKKNAPYDAVVVTAACPRLPKALVEQLAEGGRVVIPIGDKFSQTLYTFTKKEGDIVEKPVCGCAFVPLVGEDGWKD